MWPCCGRLQSFEQLLNATSIWTWHQLVNNLKSISCRLCWPGATRPMVSQNGRTDPEMDERTPVWGTEEAGHQPATLQPGHVLSPKCKVLGDLPGAELVEQKSVGVWCLEVENGDMMWHVFCFCLFIAFVRAGWGFGKPLIPFVGSKLLCTCASFMVCMLLIYADSLGVPRTMTASWYRKILGFA